MFVFFDGKSKKVLVLDEKRKRFVASTSANGEIKKQLHALFAESFAPDDVYWSYSLVKHASFFGYKDGEVDHKKEFVDTEYLYKRWAEIKTQKP